MGLLKKGKPLSWAETKPHVDAIKEQGIQQFISLYNRLKVRHGDALKWGDEIEYLLLHVDDEAKKVTVSLRGYDVMSQLAAESADPSPDANNAAWCPEYAAYMLEGTPGRPYGGLLSCFNHVEDNMKRRRAEAEALLEPGEILMTIPNFPLLGCPGFTTPPTQPTPGDPNAVSRSLFFPDPVIAKHPRFSNLTRNIRLRRGSKVVINVPIFKDKNTPSPFTEDFAALGDDGEAAKAAKPDHIYMDAMGFGMGCCCLQVTFQTVNVSEARWLYDQLTPLTPILLALSAATPIFRGFLADVDSRWDVISASVDDRTEEERGVKPLKNDKFRINKSRYDTTDCYIYPCSQGYNDIELQYSKEHYDALREGGIDPMLASHVAHLFIRDPLQVYPDRINLDSKVDNEHFETIQSSNWCNMRWKPAPPDSPSIGWRVEFRPTEVQLTDFENAAYCCFVVLVTRVIVSFRLSFLIPISLVNENMDRAQKRDAITEQKFYFRRGLSDCKTPPSALFNVCCDTAASADIVEMSAAEVINGKADEFPGFVRLIKQYLDTADVDVDTRCTISQYLKFISARATGEIWTLARWMREFVQSHPGYKQDSVVSQEISYDMVKAMDDISRGKAHCPKLLGTFRTKTAKASPSENQIIEAVGRTANSH